MMNRAGRVYRVDWPEYHVECEECGNSIIVTEFGGAYSKKEAEAILKAGKAAGLDDGAQNWTKTKKKWYCPKCAPKDAKTPQKPPHDKVAK